MRRALILLVALLAACRTVPLADPAPISPAPTPELTRRAILRALIHERFELVEDAPGRIRAQIHGRYYWVITVDVEYGDGVQVRYVDSRKLGYEMRGGVRYIHDDYNARAQRLQEAIAREELLITAEFDPDRLLGPPVSAPPPPPNSDR